MARRRVKEEPTMSDNTILMNVEHLINIAMGPANKNVVNFKMVQAILHILARQMRMLETLVEIRIPDDEEAIPRRLSDIKEVKHKEKVRGSSKEREKAERAASKDREQAERAASKERKKADKEGDKEARAASKEREKAVSPDKKAAKDDKREKEKDKTASDTSIVITEEERNKEKVLVVEKGPAARSSDTRVRDSIEVVTRSQFDLVLEMVKGLQSLAGPLPTPALPDNKKLVEDLAKGSASLTDTMQAMQVNARIGAAEQAIARLGDLLTALAAAGALPSELADQIDEIKSNADAVSQGGKSGKAVSIDPHATGRPSVATLGRPSAVRSVTSAASRMTVPGAPGITQVEMNEALRMLREDMMKNVQNLTAKATSIAENASMSIKALWLNTALGIDRRISTLYSLVGDYGEQLSGFGTGLSTQMQSFNEQMVQLQGELAAGLKQLEMVNNNAETAAVKELTERYEGLVTDLDTTVTAHRDLTDTQSRLADDLHGLMQCVEMLREQKADRDEVLDGLRDKADMSRLEGLLTALEFAAARADLEARLDACHDKFRRQEDVWMTALGDLGKVAETKAELTEMLAARDQAERALNELMDMQAKLELILGEPNAAMLTRLLARDASCGACLLPAHMEPYDKDYGAPPPLPAMRPRPLGAAGDEPCTVEWKPKEPPDDREHACRRWVGGSHTLVSEFTTRERAPAMVLIAPPTKKYTGYGADGRLYMLEEEMLPCVECNQLEDLVPGSQHNGAGDQGNENPPAT